jgi:DNA-binding LytR/AlgR family response regulator
MAALVGQLPVNEFARIHRGAIIRLDRVQEIRRLGRGDASIFLSTGQALRLSRRYRANLAVHVPL